MTAAPATQIIQTREVVALNRGEPILRRDLEAIVLAGTADLRATLAEVRGEVQDVRGQLLESVAAVGSPVNPASPASPASGEAKPQRDYKNLLRTMVNLTTEVEELRQQFGRHAAVLEVLQPGPSESISSLSMSASCNSQPRYSSPFAVVRSGDRDREASSAKKDQGLAAADAAAAHGEEAGVATASRREGSRDKPAAELVILRRELEALGASVCDRRNDIEALQRLCGKNTNNVHHLWEAVYSLQNEQAELKRGEAQQQLDLETLRASTASIEDRIERHLGAVSRQQSHCSGGGNDIESLAKNIATEWQAVTVLAGDKAETEEAWLELRQQLSALRGRQEETDKALASAQEKHLTMMADLQRLKAEQATSRGDQAATFAAMEPRAMEASQTSTEMAMEASLSPLHPSSPASPPSPTSPQASAVRSPAAPHRSVAQPPAVAVDTVAAQQERLRALQAPRAVTQPTSSQLHPQPRLVLASPRPAQHRPVQVQVWTPQPGPTATPRQREQL